ncbi:E3 ubiquitin-protein ligase RNF14-like isoform X2 [Amphiura filiformis]|uniref:E3 ubiquitin-protein ligase RNF14-like isoform X2 n=1 Tax=Amphiura filiformis TaxID=82378 RepID=UPI003B2207C1
MSEDDKEAQSDELLALASIYEEGIFTAADDGSGGQFAAHIQLPLQPFLITLDEPMIDQAKRVGVKLHQEGSDTHLPVHHLPPIVLNFQYPSDYPSCSAPSFTLSCKWLSINQLSKLCAKLDDIWKENSNEVILFLWTQFLIDESLDILELSSPITLDTEELQRKRPSTSRQTSQDQDAAACDEDATQKSASQARTDKKEEAATASVDPPTSTSSARTCDSRAVQDIASVPHLIPAIIDHDQAERQRAFNLAVYSCNVCFSEKQGSDCINFMGCDHVYCKECMKEYFKVQISDGNVKCLNCPETDCDSQALPSQVRELVGQELFATYDRLLLQLSLEGMEDIVYCPRLTCQCPVMLEKESTMGVCPRCKLAFCVLCKMTYHGTSPCRLRSEHLAGIRRQWESGDPEERKELERRYGKKNLIQAVEENYSVEWMKRFSKKCPSCGASIEKIDGCNKMTCFKCHTYFCWICLTVVNKANPYGHFNQPGSPCFNLLFQGVETNDDDDEWEVNFF